MVAARRDLLEAIEEASFEVERPIRKRAPPRVRPSTIDEVIEEVQLFVRKGDFSAAKALHVVGLYVVCHEHVYGVKPLELDGAAWFLAKRAVEKLAEECFDGDLTRVVAYVQWAWTREKEREDWRRTHKSGGSFRMGWRLMFGSRNVVTDYFANLARTAR